MYILKKRLLPMDIRKRKRRRRTNCIIKPLSSNLRYSFVKHANYCIGVRSANLHAAKKCAGRGRYMSGRGKGQCHITETEKNDHFSGRATIALERAERFRSFHACRN